VIVLQQAQQLKPGKNRLDRPWCGLTSRPTGAAFAASGTRTRVYASFQHRLSLTPVFGWRYMLGEPPRWIVYKVLPLKNQSPCQSPGPAAPAIARCPVNHNVHAAGCGLRQPLNTAAE
jgi:hypothetical protein